MSYEARESIRPMEFPLDSRGGTIQFMRRMISSEIDRKPRDLAEIIGIARGWYRCATRITPSNHHRVIDRPAKIRPSHNSISVNKQTATTKTKATK